MKRFTVGVAVLVGVGLAGGSAHGQSGAFSYQGYASVGGVPINGPADFEFRLYQDEATPGALGVETQTGVPVTNGRFSTILNQAYQFGFSFNGQDRWLEVVVNGVVLSPRQRITATPYALWSHGPWLTTGPGETVFQGRAEVGPAPSGNEALLVRGNLTLQDDASVIGLGRLVGFGGLGLHADSQGDPDVYIGTDGSVGIGTTTPLSRLHVNGDLTLAADADIGAIDGLYGFNDLKLYGDDFGGPDVFVSANGNVGVGTSAPISKLHVEGDLRLADNASIYGTGNVFGFNLLKLSGDAFGGPDLVIGPGGQIGQRQYYANVAFNIRGQFPETELFNVELSDGSYIFNVSANRDVTVSGDLIVVGGTKNFVIDHPVDPSTRDLAHNAVEGPGYFTHYHGTTVLGEDGTAWVELPRYFDALNTEPAYQLTCVGGWAPVFIAEEAKNNRFRIGGGKAGMKVSWTVHATRNDPYARDHPYEAERTKAKPGVLYYDPRDGSRPSSISGVGAGTLGR